MGVFDELKARGLIAQMTHEEKIKELLNNEKVTFYIGFDPTADSLHVGHLMQMIIMSHMQRAGHKPIALIGGGTAMVGDPSGRTDMRSMMTKETIEHNGQCFVSQMNNVVDFGEGEGKATLVNNADWLLGLNYVDFLRDIGTHFSVNRMLSAECFKTRLEKGLSFIEFNYMLMQSYDFLKLHDDYNCVLELGGDDQWSNIIGGIELVRRVKGEEAYGMTFALLTTSEGKKMGKTMSGAVWLDPKKTSPYEFYQYWRNTEDASVIKCLKFLTFLPLSEIESMAEWKDSKLNEAKEILAYEVTKTVHGAEEADKARAAAKAIFGGSADINNMPFTDISPDVFSDGGAEVAQLMVLCSLAKSKGEARRLIEQGGVSVNDDKVTDPKATLSREDFADGYVIIKKGKKIFHKANIL
ncbi:MAG: tyrosine--tRNA ligase [Oscillospiraceae bacterium]|jgi:tyrosyl-tRNA synthetase|nr:tyrosine--tRNA ligase [Oscillospiraceae bacterium]